MAEISSVDEDKIIDWLANRVAEEMKLPAESIPVDETFFNLGLNSLNTLIISGELGEFLNNYEFGPSVFWDYPTIQKLAEHLAEQPQVAAGAS